MWWYRPGIPLAGGTRHVIGDYIVLPLAQSIDNNSFFLSPFFLLSNRRSTPRASSPCIALVFTPDAGGHQCVTLVSTHVGYVRCIWLFCSLLDLYLHNRKPLTVLIKD